MIVYQISTDLKRSQYRRRLSRFSSDDVIAIERSEQSNLGIEIATSALRASSR